jgi:hypothetical protein
MNIPKATWRDYPPSIEFESTDLPMDVVKELAKLALNQVNIHIRRGDVMHITAEGLTDEGAYVFHLGPKIPITRVFGPDVVEYHNKQTEPIDRHEALINYARHMADLSHRDKSE